MKVTVPEGGFARNEQGGIAAYFPWWANGCYSTGLLSPAEDMVESGQLALLQQPIAPPRVDSSKGPKPVK